MGVGNPANRFEPGNSKEVMTVELRNKKKPSFRLPPFSSAYSLYFPLFLLLLITSCSGKPVGPRLKFLDSNFYLGSVEQGAIAEKKFRIKNVGDADLVINDITTTCGCTAALIDKKLLSPGETGTLEVTILTSGKRDLIEKKIVLQTNDTQEPSKEITVSVKVETQAHPNFDVNKSVFSPGCDKCHIGKAAQYKEYSLYLEVCSMCHGTEGEGGGDIMAINGPDYLASVDDDYLLRWIAEGKLGTSMPGYSKKKNGPLTDKQIESLVVLIRSWE